jgi:5-methylcytosine-specific restriction enzyme subunit McrC
MFLDEVSALTKKGLKAAYTSIEENARYCKGKLLACQNIKHNWMIRDRFFVRYDEFSTNMPEIKLIKSTLIFLLKTSGDSRNMLTFFDGVEHSKDFSADFSKFFGPQHEPLHQGDFYAPGFSESKQLNSLCRKRSCSCAPLSDGERFESFVAAKFHKHIGSGVSLRTQGCLYCLFDSPTRFFAIRPDIVLESDGHAAVLDAKWKLLSGNLRNNGISEYLLSPCS